jgi:hypothetical protein
VLRWFGVNELHFIFLIKNILIIYNYLTFQIISTKIKQYFYVILYL